MLPENIIFVAVTLNLIGEIFYVRTIIRGNTRPNLVSWIMWMLAPSLGFFFEIKAGAGLAALPVFINGFGSFIIFISAFLTKNGTWKINNYDILCGLFSLWALVIYIFTHNLGLSIIFAILSDFLAFIPTYIKGWEFSETEHHSTYTLAAFSNIVGLLIIKNWSFNIYSFGAYLVIANVIMVTILYRKRFLNDV